MTEPQQQPWPTTVQRRRQSGAANVESDVPGSDGPGSDVPTPRHSHSAVGLEATRVPSPFPRPRDAAVGHRNLQSDTGTPRSYDARPAATVATTVVARDSTAMTALRIITYVLGSLASLAFLAIVVYAGIKVVQLRDTLSTSPLGSLTGSSASPDAGAGPAICDVDPANAACYGG